MSFQEYPKSVTINGEVHLAHSKADEDRLRGVVPDAPASAGWAAPANNEEPVHPAATGWGTTPEPESEKE